MPSRIALALAAVAVAAAVLTSACTGGEAEAPSFEGNVVLVVVDSLRADHLGLYGYGRPTSPFLDALAEESVVFEHAWAPSSYTSQSMAAILTGRLPTSGGSIGLMEAEPSGSATNLPQHFARAGLRTGVVSNQPLLRRRGFTRGFEDVQVTAMENPWKAAEVSRRALTFVEDAAGDAFFLTVYYAEPHQPYNAPAEVRARFPAPETDTDVSVPGLQKEIESSGLADADPRLEALVASYDAEIAAVDEAIEALVAGLEEQGVLAETTLVVTASQGEEHLDHGYLGHAWTLFEEVLRVPLLIRSAQLEPQRINEPVSLVEISPSLLTLAGIESTEHSDGDSFLRRGSARGSDSQLQVGPSNRPKIAELVIAERCIHRAVLDGDWKYIQSTTDCPVAERRAIAADYPTRLLGAADGTLILPDIWGEPVAEHLFQLADDPGERNNLADSQPDQLDRMRAVLSNYASWCRENALSPGEAIAPANMADPATTERLESLGYL